MASHHGFNCISVMASDVEHLLCIFVILVPCVLKKKSLCSSPFSNCFQMLEFREFSNLETSPLLEMQFAGIFFPDCGWVTFHRGKDF